MTETKIENSFSLDDLKRATKRRLGPTTFAIGDELTVEFPSIFRLPKKVRTKVWDALKQIDDLGDSSDEDEVAGYELLVETISDVLRLITPKADELLAAVVDSEDPLFTANVLGEILSKWMENVSAGEA